MAPDDDSLVRVVRFIRREGPRLRREFRVAPRVIRRLDRTRRLQSARECARASVWVRRDDAGGGGEQLRRPGPPEGVQQDAPHGGERGGLGASRGCRRATAVPKVRRETRGCFNRRDGRVPSSRDELRQ